VLLPAPEGPTMAAVSPEKGKGLHFVKSCGSRTPPRTRSHPACQGMNLPSTTDSYGRVRSRRPFRSIHATTSPVSSRVGTLAGEKRGRVKESRIEGETLLSR
jgi:hypothetical protein